MPKVFQIILWVAISALGAGSVAFSAFHKGETINALWLVVAGMCSFAVAYRFYSKWLMTKVLVLDAQRATPAHTKEDGKDFVPTNKWVVFGHHFAAIAGPGPLVGPVLAAQFGYLPGMLWILIGATLGGGVHDAIVMFASIRRGGKSVGQMLKEEVNPFVGMVAMISVLAIMTILLAVLGLVVVKALAESPWGLFTIAMTIPLAFIMGFGHTIFKVSVRDITIFGIVGLLLSVWAGSHLKDWGIEHFFDYKGVPQTTDPNLWTGMTNGFHMDVDASAATIDNVTIVINNTGGTYSPIFLFDTGDWQFRTDTGLLNGPYEKVYARKFTFAPFEISNLIVLILYLYATACIKADSPFKFC